MNVYFKDYKLRVFAKVYKPAEDSFMLAENLEIREKDKVLDMGTGCGIQAIVASENAKEVHACDINVQAIRCARFNAEEYEREIEVFWSDLFSNILESYDVVVFNPPYLPSERDEKKDIETKAWNGGKKGREVLDRFLEEVPDYLKKNGKLFLVQSSLTDLNKTVEKLKNFGFKVEIKEKRRFFFEELYVIKAVKNS